jgi:polyisoprenoid-binding protein YceI
MRHLIGLLAASIILLSHAAFAAFPAYTLVKDKSSLKFYAIQNGAPVAGAFKNFDADIRFDPDQPGRSSVTVEVDMTSITSVNSDVEQNVKAPDWLSVAAFPKAIFKADKMTRMPSSQNYYARGQLSLRGVTKPVVLNFTLDHLDDKRAIVTGFATIPRSDFGVGQGSWAKDDVVKNEVRVEFRIVADRK